MAASHTLKLAPEVITILKASEITPTSVKLTCGQLDRKTYGDVAKILKEAGGKWTTSKQAFLGAAGWTAKLTDALSAGVINRDKVIFQKFYTPDSVADLLVEEAMFEHTRLGLAMAKPRILEPSCGDGALIRAALRRAPLARIDAYDLDPEARGGGNVTCIDFLTVAPVRQYDAILMNPPYQKGQAEKHVLHAAGFLKTRGSVLAAIVPTTFDDDASFTILAKIGAWKMEKVSIPAGAFKESGTGIATDIRIFLTHPV